MVLYQKNLIIQLIIINSNTIKYFYMDLNQSFSLPPEIEEGNIEYKRKIDGLTSAKITKFTTQMLWRINEGKQILGVDEAIYYIGIENNGEISGVDNETINESIKNFTMMTKLCNVEIYSTKIYHDIKGIVAVLKIRKIYDYILHSDIKVCLLGASRAGKTTFLGNIAFDLKDDGFGAARRSILRHSHEKQNGTTSSIKCEIIGFKDNKCLNYANGFINSWENIVKNSDKIINFIDLPGSTKYLKTTLFGLLSYLPDYILLFISLPDIYQNNKISIDNETKMYADLCIRVKLPFILIFTKRDLLDEKIINFIIQETKSIINCDENIPCVCISAVNSDGIEDIKLLLNKIDISKGIITNNKNIANFMINDVTFIPDVGYVISGILNEGRIKINNSLFIGPINRTFYNVTIKSIHKKQIPCKYLYQNETGSLVIKFDDKIDANKHLMIVSHDQLIKFKNTFKIVIKRDQSGLDCIKIDSEFMIFYKNVYDVIIITNIIDNDDLFLIIEAEFKDNIHYIENNEYIIIRNNNTIIVGKLFI
jgi:GTPase